MKKILSLIICLILLVGTYTTAFAMNFNGASNWAVPELKTADADGFITEKIAENMGDNITREEFCEIALILYDKIGSLIL